MNYELLTINKNGNLLYNGNKIFGTGNCELFKNYYFKEKLGHGANGIALIAIIAADIKTKTMILFFMTIYILKVKKLLRQ